MSFAVIMSGGSGRRFWPVSRTSRAKQLIPLFDGKTLLELTVERLIPVFGPDRILVVTQREQGALTEQALERLGDVRILCEPVGRNTAACIAYASTYIESEFGESVAAFVPADHLIEFEDRFREILSAGIDFVERNDRHLTIGIRPDRPATGFGYIKRGSRVGGGGGLDFYRVAEFTEKPSDKVARTYVESGEYLWNSGMFVFKTSSILDEIRAFLPETARGFEMCRGSFGTPDAEERLTACYSDLQDISIDYGVMEKTGAACVVPADIGWDDLGNWDSFAKYMPTDNLGNAVLGKHIGVDSQDCLVYSDKQLISTLGISGIAVIATEDAVLVMPRKKGEEVKRVVRRLEEEGLTDLL